MFAKQENVINVLTGVREFNGFNFGFSSDSLTIDRYMRAGWEKNVEGTGVREVFSKAVQGRTQHV